MEGPEDNQDVARTDQLLPCILDGKYFTYLPDESVERKRVGLCMLCSPRQVKISGFSDSTSNFITHLKRRHGEAIFAEYVKYSKNYKTLRKQSSGVASSQLKLNQEVSSREVLPCILDGKFFTYLPEESSDTKTTALCTLCAPTQVKIKGFRNATSNFVTHLKRRHGKMAFTEYIMYSKTHRRPKRRPSSNSNIQRTLNQVVIKREQALPQIEINQDISGREREVSQLKLNRDVSRAEETLPRILDGKFFIYLPDESLGPQVVALCALCAPGEVKIKGFRNASSNFLTHLKRRHGKAAVTEYIKYSRSHKRPKKQSPNNNNPQLNLNQDEFNRNITNYFIHSLIPLQNVNNPYFKKIFDLLDISKSGLTVMSRRTLMRCISDDYERAQTRLKNKLHDIKTVSTTAKISSNKQRNFLGVMCHWINPELQRMSATLGCRQFSGPCDQIDLLLENIHTEFDLDCQRVLSTISDTSSAKACKELVLKENSENLNDDESETEGNDLINETKPLFMVGIITGEPTTSIPRLPSHLRCCAQELTMCCTVDSNYILNHPSSVLFKMHNHFMTKCNALWEAASRPESSEIINSIIGYTFSRPEPMTFNSFYNSLRQISSIHNMSIELHLALNINNPLMEADFQYVDEYLKCSKPIADALEILQGDKDLFYGILLPTLLSLRIKLSKLSKEKLNYCDSLVSQYLRSVNERFREYFEFFTPIGTKAIIASMSYPRFKDKWLAIADPSHHVRIKNIFIEQISQITENREEISEASVNIKTEDDSFFDFESDCSESESVFCSEAERLMSRYLCDSDKETSMLNRHPEIKELFIKYNTSMASAGPTEMLFSDETMVNLPNSHNISDEMLEQRLLLKSYLK